MDPLLLLCWVDIPFVSRRRIHAYMYGESKMMQARKIKYDVMVNVNDIMVLTETRRHRALHAVFDTGEELFLGTATTEASAM
ncbi:hypothetical protein V3C99_018503 [Haemonchus contortus]|uniref:Uncharacterized protein n=1 Tax=Haemonchus contortus TaxID=6289 RepID=A0A7I4Z4J3_HAECO